MEVPASAPDIRKYAPVNKPGSSLAGPENPVGLKTIGLYYSYFAAKETEKLRGSFKVTQMLMGLGLELCFSLLVLWKLRDWWILSKPCSQGWSLSKLAPMNWLEKTFFKLNSSQPQGF